MPGRSQGAWQALTDPYRRRLVRALGGGDAALAVRRYLRGDALSGARGKPADEHQARVARGTARGLTPTQAAGRPLPSEAPASAFRRWFSGVSVRLPDGTALVDLDVSTTQASTVGRYNNDVRRYSDGQLAAEEFGRRWRGRRVAGQQLEYDPDRALEAQRRGRGSGADRYRRTVAGSSS